MEVVAPLISNEKQMKNIVTSMTTLLSASTLPVSVSMPCYHQDFMRVVAVLGNEEHDCLHDIKFVCIQPPC